MEMMRQATIIVSVFIFFLAVPESRATILIERDDKDLAQKAELIFAGTVTGIETRLSDRIAEGDAILPHTFVTFSIERLIKGSSTAGNSVTLRFLGGPGRRGRHMGVIGMPNFLAGDQVILFVKGNGVRICPVVGWSQGRFHVLGENLVGEHGESIWLTPSGGLVRGPIDEAALAGREAPLGMPEIKASPVAAGDDFSGDEKRDGVDRGETEPKGSRLDAGTFLHHVDRLVERLHEAEELRRLAPVISADPARSFTVRSPRPVPLRPNQRPAANCKHEEHAQPVVP